MSFRLRPMPRLTFMLPVIIVVLGLVLRLWGVQFGLPYRYHIDEPPHVLAALNIAQGNLHIEYPFNSPNLFQFILAFEYGVFYLVGLVSGYFGSPADIASLYESDPSLFYLLARGTSVFFGVATICLIYHLGKRVRNRRVAYSSALLLAVAFIHVRDSHYGVTDTLVTFLSVSCVLASVCYRKDGRQRNLILAGLAGGAASALKYLPASFLLMPALVILLRLWGRPWREWAKPVALLATSVVIGFLISFPSPLLDYGLFRLHLAQAFGQATNPLNSFVVDTHPAAIYYLRTLVWGVGWPLLASALAGLIVCSVRRSTSERLVVFAVMVYYAGISLMSTFFARYALPIVPLIALFAATAVDDLIDIIQRRTRTWVEPLLVFSLLSFLVAHPALASIQHNYLLTRADTRTLAKEWIEENFPSGTRLVAQWFGPELSNLNEPTPVSNRRYDILELTPFDREPGEYQLRSWLDRNATYILVNSFNWNLRLHDPVENTKRADFYRDLEQNAELVAEFWPTCAQDPVPFIWDQLYGPATSLHALERPGPAIRIFRLEHR